MSEKTNLVLAAVQAGATTRTDIAEGSGLTPQEVSVELTMLKARGLVARTDDGWVETDSPPPAGAVPAPETEPPKPRRSRKPKGARKPRATGGGTAAARGSEPQVAVFGEYVVMKRADAQRLLELRHLIIQSAHLIG